MFFWRRSNLLADSRSSHRPSDWGWLLPLVVIGLLFGPALVRSGNFSYRDTSHYYYPLFAWTVGEIKSHGLPLWNPLEDNGVSLAADPTASLYYPPKCLLFLPFGFDFSFKLYIVVHYGIAAIGMYRFLRHIGRSSPAASLGAIAYTAGGNVLIQYANLPFLVGAAWLPAVVQGLDRLWRQPTRSHAMRLALPWALMALGGDVQLAFHLGLITCLWVGLGRHAGARQTKSGNPRWLLRGGMLIAAALMVVLLTAIQTIPSYCYTRQTTRALWDEPRNVYEWAASSWSSHGVKKGRTDNLVSQVGGSGGQRNPGLLARTTPGSHQHTIYQFSVGPWRWPELFWPNIGGRQYPQSHRWMNALPAEGRVWTPSLYAGLFPVFGSLIALRFRRGGLRRRWFSWVALLSLLASLGEFGIVWLLQEVLHAVGSGQTIAAGSPVGGLYWCLTVIIPGYVQFRYPAKWWILTQFAGIVLAASAMDMSMRRCPIVARWWRIGCSILIGLSGVLGGAVLAIWPRLAPRLVDATPDRLFGPIDALGARNDVLMSLVHAVCVAISLAIVGGWYRRSGTGRAPWRAWGIVGITAIELCIAQRWMIVTAPAESWKGPTLLHDHRPLLANAPLTSSNEATELPSRWLRMRRSNGWPAAWSRSADPQRQTEAVRWEHRTLYPKHQLLLGVGIVGTSSSMPRADFAAWLAEVTRGLAEQPTSEAAELLQIDGTVVGDRIHFATPARETRQRAWCTPHFATLPTIHSPRLSDLAQQTRSVLQLRKTLEQHAAVVETDTPTPFATPLIGGNERVETRTDASTCEWVRFTPNKLELRVSTPEACWLVLGEQYDDGWRATVETTGITGSREIPVYRANRIARALPLEAGEHHVTLVYRPIGWQCGYLGSLIGWLLLLASVGFDTLKSENSARAACHPAYRPACATWVSRVLRWCRGQRCG